MSKKYDASSIEVITDDRERVRIRPTMYIPTKGTSGAVHIIFEAVDNALDEVTRKDSLGDSITTIFDESKKITTVIDNGSGIPHEKLYDVCTVLNSSGKFNNDDNSVYNWSGGTNGVGNKLVTYLSDWSEINSMRSGKSLKYKFDDGVLVDTKEDKTKEHGTIVKFKLSQKYVNINDVTLDMIKDRYEEKSYIFPNTKMQLIITKNDKEVATYTYTGKDIVDRVRMWKPDTDVIRITDSKKVNTLKNINDDDITNVKVEVDLAFAYKDDAVEDPTDKFIISYGNTIKTYTGGTHVDGLKDGLVKFFKNEIIPNLGKRDSELQITPNDITSGLCAFIVARVHNPEYRGQYKDQLSNQEVKFAVRDVVYDTLKKEKGSIIKQMEEFVKHVTRGRMASKKVRKKDVSNAFSKDRLDKFKDIIYNMDTKHPELILVEGDSAADAATGARDANNQAIYPIKRPANIFDNTTHQVNTIRTVFNDIMDICGIEPGKNCDPSKCRMEHIWMLTDGDIDGDNIAFSMVCLLAKHCKPLIDAGIVGRIIPPAYSFPTGKKDPKTKKEIRQFVHSQRELFDTITKSFVNHITIGYKNKDFDKKDLFEFLTKNFEYDKKLEKLSSRYCCDPKIMEYIARKYHGDVKTQKKSYWMEALKSFNGVTITAEKDCLIIDGDIPGYEYINLPLDGYFDRYINRFKPYQAQNDHITGYTYNGEKDKSLYDIMHNLREYMPKGIKRYKGLGELDKFEMHELCMDQKNRTVIIFKFKDFAKDMYKISVIMSTKKEYVAARAKILMSISGDDMDIDT